MARPPESGAEPLQAALSSVARAISDSLELKEVWDRVAEACRTIVPFDTMGVSRVEGDRVRITAVTGVPAADHLVETEFARADYSPRLWPPGGDYVLLIHDAPQEVDQSFAVDQYVVGRGHRSIMRVSLGRGRGELGSLILTAHEPHRFTEEHGRALAVVAELVALALAHEKLAGRWREHRKRRDALERLIPTLTGTLDVRAVFEQIADIAAEVVPNDFMALTLLTEDRGAEIAYAKAGLEGDVHEMPQFPVPKELQHVLDWDYILARDISVVEARRVRMHILNLDPLPPSVLEFESDDSWIDLHSEVGIRSILRANVRRNGVPIGGLIFASHHRAQFDDDHAEFAMRVADHVALALAHHDLAEEARRTAAAHDRATRLEERVQVLADELETRSPHRALGRSKKWKDVLAQATKVAPTDTTVLLTGESGTGKEVVARFIHRASARKNGPFVALNCAALPEQLLESELFGHEKGSFTGAIATRPGKIEQAAGGLLFLDEIGEMSPAVQAKFLRVLQEREYQRLGGTRTLKADMRVLAATNRNLKAAIAQGTFREDLFYRIAVFDIALPPLRDRPEDILLLVDAFLDEIGHSVGRPAAGASEEVRAKLVAYRWPGNVRELHNAVERAVILCEGGLITSEHLPIGIAGTSRVEALLPTTVITPPSDAMSLDAAEREMILQALSRAGNNKSKAARILGLTRAQLRSRIEKHGLTVES